MDMTCRIFVSTILRFIWILILIIGADAQLTVHTPTDLSVREGDNVTLVCTYEPRTEPAFFDSITWLMADGVLASYSCSNSCSRTNINTDQYTLDSDARFSGNLTIYGITMEDDSFYRCIVTTIDGFAESELLHLRVNVPPVNLKLSDTMTPGGYEQGDIVPVLSGQSYTLNCSIQSGANPSADLEWTSTTAQITQGVKDDQEVTGSKLTMSSREVTFTPTMADHLTSVTCEATHPALDTSLTRFIQLDVQVTPSNVNISFNSAMILDGETLTLQEGTPSVITCESLGTQPASTITWYLEGVPVTFGISTPEFSPNAGDSRLSDASSSIIIQPTRENHEQILRCQAETFGISQDTSIRLSVDGPPDPPVITGIPDNLIENQQTSISCQADNGHPSPLFQWFIGNRNLTGDATLQVSADVNNRIDATSQLRYLPLREDNGRALQCNVIHDALSQPLKVMSDTLTVNYCPTSVEVIVCPEVKAWSSEAMVCRSDASNPASNLVWIEGDDTIIEPSDLQKHFEESIEPLGILTISSYMRNFSKDDYEQSFTCCNISPLCDSTVCSEPCIPNVIYPPTTSNISSNKPYGAMPEGTENLEILCNPGEGRPRPEVVWVFSDDPSHSLEQVSLANGSQLLIFSEVSRANAGMYRCIANNKVPPTSSADHQLVVEFPSTIRNKVDNTELALEGENVTFICEVEGMPSTSITWQQLRNQSDELDNGILVTQSEQRTVYRSLVTSTLIIAEVIPEMYNTTFSCVANNSYGIDRKNFHLKKPDLESRKKLAPALISVAFIVILLILIFVIIGWRLSRKHKQAGEQSQSPRGKSTHVSDPCSSIKEDKPYAELSNTGMKTQEHDYMPLNTYETMELADRSPPNREDKPYAELSNTGMKTQEHDYMPLSTYETPMELADRSPRGAPNSTLGQGGVTARTNLEHTYANAEERGSREDSRENDYINNTVLIPRVI